MIIHDITRLIVLLVMQNNCFFSCRYLQLFYYNKLRKKKIVFKLLRKGTVCIFLIITMLLGGSCREVEQKNNTDLLQLEQEEIIKKLCPYIVRIEANNLYGSGVVFEETEDYFLIITNSHLLNQNVVRVSFFDGSSCDATKVSEYQSKYDLSFLKVDKKNLDNSTKDVCQRVSYDKEIYLEMKPGDDLFIMGFSDYPTGNLSIGTIGNKSIYIEEFDSEMLWVYGEVIPGMSGSGVFDKYGNLIGIVCGGNNEKETVALSILQILSEYEMLTF